VVKGSENIKHLFFENVEKLKKQVSKWLIFLQIRMNNENIVLLELHRDWNSNFRRFLGSENAKFR
jgi:hypothetical protein